MQSLDYFTKKTGIEETIQRGCPEVSNEVTVAGRGQSEDLQRTGGAGIMSGLVIGQHILLVLSGVRTELERASIPLTCPTTHELLAQFTAEVKADLVVISDQVPLPFELKDSTRLRVLPKPRMALSGFVVQGQCSLVPIYGKESHREQLTAKQAGENRKEEGGMHTLLK